MTNSKTTSSTKLLPAELNISDPEQTIPSDDSAKNENENGFITGDGQTTKKVTNFSADPEKGEFLSDKANEASSDETKIGPIGIVLRIMGILILLYMFICSLDILSNSFRLIGGATAGEIFSKNEALRNPLAGLMIGVLATVLVQSSSTSSSIVVAMVSSGILEVSPAVPIIMGANIGTSVTNTLVAVTQFQSDDIFERSFAGATVHDMFNVLSVIILLPVNNWSYLLEYCSEKMVDVLNLPEGKDVKVNTLNVITDPLTDLIVLVDKDVIKKISQNAPLTSDDTILQVYCEDTRNATEIVKCPSLFSQIGWSDTVTGIILLICSIIALFFCLIFLVKILQSIFRGHISKVIHKTVNADFPGPLKYLTGPCAILIGALMTILVQSSSIFTSTLTPLIGLNIITLERAYPLTLGSNIGTTVTSILAALASEGQQFRYALQIAFCHLLFNVCGIILWYPAPIMRRAPINLARCLGRITKKYPWFSIVYIIVMFFILPGTVFAISLLGQTVFLVVLIVASVFICLILVLVIMQKFCQTVLPEQLQTFEFLPIGLRSLAPYHNFMLSVKQKCSSKTAERVERLRRLSERSVNTENDQSNRRNNSSTRNASGGKRYNDNIKSTVKVAGEKIDAEKDSKTHCGSGSDVDSAQEARETQAASNSETHV